MHNIQKPLAYVGSYWILLLPLGFRINGEIRITENHVNSWNSFPFVGTSDALASGNKLAYVLDCIIQRRKHGNTGISTCLCVCFYLPLRTLEQLPIYVMFVCLAAPSS